MPFPALKNILNKKYQCTTRAKKHRGFGGKLKVQSFD